MILRETAGTIKKLIQIEKELKEVETLAKSLNIDIDYEGLLESLIQAKLNSSDS